MAMADHTDHEDAGKTPMNFCPGGTLDISRW
ncbi:MAG: hypothetical protein HONDAALG_03328 [Gammaproteobacteria bacterium]|nr:hypothetical protein [Gammaproteobacteria bacterium]